MTTIKTKSEVKVTVTRKWYATLRHPKITGIIPFSECGDFVASLVAGVVSFMVEGRVGSVKG